MSVQNFIKSVTEEKNGFILDEAWRLNEESLSVIVPVLRKSKAKRAYITLAEAKDVKVEDTGQIDYVYVQNNEDAALLISRGEIFRGKTQERAAVHGHIIMAGKGARVAVRCIHQSKGIRSGAEMKYGGRVPSDINLSNQANAWNSVSAHFCSYRGIDNVGGIEIGAQPRNIKMPLKKNVSKGKDDDNTNMTSTLNNVMYCSNNTVEPDNLGMSENEEGSNPIFRNMRSNIGASDDLVGTLDDMSDMIKEMMKKIPPIKNQVGAIFLYENYIKGLDIYDLPDSWKSVKEDVVAKEGSDYLKKENNNIFEFKPEKVKKLVGQKLSGTFEEKILYDGKDYRIIEIREVVEDDKKTRLLGEAVEFKNKVIHLTMYSS